MRDNASRLGAVDAGTPLMILAFVVIGGFMFWLNGEAAEERALAIVEDTVVDATVGVADVSIRDLEADPTNYLGNEVRLANYGVASMLGSQGFWLGTESGNPFLVSMSAQLMAEGLPITPGDTIVVSGVLTAMNDSVLSAWEAAATVTETDRLVAEFAINFLEADAVTITGDGGSGSN